MVGAIDVDHDASVIATAYASTTIVPPALTPRTAKEVKALPPNSSWAEAPLTMGAHHSGVGARPSAVRRR